MEQAALVKILVLGLLVAVVLVINGWMEIIMLVAAAVEHGIRQTPQLGEMVEAVKAVAKHHH